MRGIIRLVRSADDRQIEAENQYYNVLKTRYEQSEQAANTVRDEIENEIRSLFTFKSSATERKIYTLNNLVRLIKLFNKKIEDKALQNYLLQLLNDHSSELEEDDIATVLSLFVNTDSLLLTFFDHYPKLAAKLSAKTLQQYAEASPNVAIKILSISALSRKLKTESSALIEVCEKHKNNLAVLLHAIDITNDNKNLIGEYFKVNDQSMAHKNVMDYVKKFSHLRAQFTVDQIKAMFGSVEHRGEFIQVLNCLLHTQENLENLEHVFSAAAISFDPLNKVESLGTRASMEQWAFARIQHHVYTNRLLLLHEKEGGNKYLSHFTCLSRALYKPFPSLFAEQLFSIPALTAQNRLNVLNANRSWLEFEQLLDLNQHMTAIAERKAYFSNGLKDADKTPADKIREGIKTILEQDGSLDVNERALILAALEKNDLRDWIDLARDPNVIVALLNKTAIFDNVSQELKYDSRVSQIIALDTKLLAALRGDAKLIKYEDASYRNFDETYGSKSDFLFAANFVLANIARSGYWFQSSRNEAFINVFINYFLNVEPKLPITITVDFESISREQKRAICWFVVNHKDFNVLLHTKMVRKNSYLRFMGAEPTDEEIKHDLSKLSGLSEYLDEIPLQGSLLLTSYVSTFHVDYRTSVNANLVDAAYTNEFTSAQMAALAATSSTQIIDRDQRSILDEIESNTGAREISAPLMPVHLAMSYDSRQVASAAAHAASITPPRTQLVNQMRNSDVNATKATQNFPEGVARNLNDVFEKAAVEKNAGDVTSAQTALQSDASVSVSVAPAMSTLFRSVPPPAPKMVKPASANAHQANVERKSLFDQISSLRSEDGNATPQLKPVKDKTGNSQPSALQTPTTVSQPRGSLLATMASSSKLALYQPPSPVKDNDESSNNDWSASLPTTPIRTPATAAVVQPMADSAASNAAPAIRSPSQIVVEEAPVEVVPTVSGEPSSEGEESLAATAAVGASDTDRLANQQALLYTLSARRSVLKETPPATPSKNPDSEEANSPSYSPW